MNTVLSLTLSGSALALLLLALRYLVLKKMPSTVYYYAWILVLLRFLLPMPGLVALPGASAEPEQAAMVTPAAETAERAQTAAADRSDTPESAVQTAPRNSENTRETEQKLSAPGKRTDGMALMKAPALWLTVWAMGSAGCFACTVCAYLRFSRRLRRRLKKPDEEIRAFYASFPDRKPALYLSSALKTPVMFGVFHPNIVLPAREYDKELLENILRHELTHYRRRDPLYKWFMVAVLSLHWFNPLAWVIRREINRACELSCDEMLLRTMSRAEKQAYGNTLLNMAAGSALPAGVVATTFSTEKKHLKERLVQIMDYKPGKGRTLAAVLAVALLIGCCAAAGPVSAEPAQIVSGERNVVRVSTVDELLAALAPDTVIELAAGSYDLSTAGDYAAESQSPYYAWNPVFSEGEVKSAELELRNLENLTIRGAGRSETTLAAVPRYANVIRFSGCRSITVENITAGHTTEPGFCSGGVLNFDTCTAVEIRACGLYGCGTIGVQARDCNDLTVTASDIYKCSYGAVEARSCRNLRVENCDIRDHGIRAGQGGAMNLLDLAYSDGAVVYGNRIHDNNAQYVLHSNYSRNVLFLSNEVSHNEIVSGVFALEEYGVTVDGCSFADNQVRGWYAGNGIFAADLEGNQLDRAALAAMSLRTIDPDAVAAPVKMSSTADLPAGTAVEVTTTDELLSAIGPDRTIVLKGELFDLSAAAGYGSTGGEYWYWRESYDGPELVLHDLKGLTIRSAASDPAAVTLSAVPRYANVLSMRDCDNVTLAGFTAGHTKEPGSCSGGVVNLENCHDITVDGMRLYGCGILGLQTTGCASLSVLRTEIYECSQGAGQFFGTDGIRFTDCSVHAIPSPALSFRECGDVVWNGDAVSGWDNEYDVEMNAVLVPYSRASEAETVFTGALAELVNPYAGEPVHYHDAGTPDALFAAAVRQAIADGDWETLAPMLRYPVQIFAEDSSFHIWTQEEFLNCVQDESFIRNRFNEAFRQRIAEADMSEYGDCAFGETCCGHLIAIAWSGENPEAEHPYVTAISLVTPFWPGRAYPTVNPPPTPQL